MALPVKRQEWQQHNIGRYLLRRGARRGNAHIIGQQSVIMPIAAKHQRRVFIDTNRQTNAVAVFPQSLHERARVKLAPHRQIGGNNFIAYRAELFVGIGRHKFGQSLRLRLAMRLMMRAALSRKGTAHLVFIVHMSPDDVQRDKSGTATTVFCRVLGDLQK